MDMGPNILSHALITDRLFNDRFPVFARRGKDFYDSTQFLVHFLDHACIANDDRNLHADPGVKSVVFKLLNAWKHAGVAVQMTAMDDQSGMKRVRPFIWCPTSYMEVKPYATEKELVMQMGRHIYKLAKPRFAESSVQSRINEGRIGVILRQNDVLSAPAVVPEKLFNDGIVNTNEYHMEGKEVRIHDHTSTYVRTEH